jgi:ABC-type xylose transport system permease subunit
MQTRRDRAQDASYRERLLVPVSWWLLAVPVVAVLGGEVYAGFGGWIPPAIYAVFIVAVAGFLLTWGATTITVAGGRARAVRPWDDDAH